VDPPSPFGATECGGTPSLPGSQQHYWKMAIRDHEISAETLGAELYHYQGYENDEFDAVIQFPGGEWSAFEVKFNPADIDEAAENLTFSSCSCYYTFVHL